jgi:hypothetical protein
MGTNGAKGVYTRLSYESTLSPILTLRNCQRADDISLEDELGWESLTIYENSIARYQYE